MANLENKINKSELNPKREDSADLEYGSVYWDDEDYFEDEDDEEDEDDYFMEIFDGEVED